MQTHEWSGLGLQLPVLLTRCAKQQNRNPLPVLSSYPTVLAYMQSFGDSCIGVECTSSLPK